MTFLEKLQTHEGGLIRINATDPFTGQVSSDAVGLLNGKIGVIKSSLPRHHRRALRAVVTLFIEGTLRTLLLYEREVEFLEERQ